MIKLPKLDNQSMYDYETNFHLTMNEERLSKFLTHFEAFKISQNIPGEIVECGVYNGNTLAFLGKTLDQFELEKKIWGYDTFEDGFLDENLSEYDTDFKKRKIKYLKKKNIQTQFFGISDVIKNINTHHKYDDNKYI